LVKLAACAGGLVAIASSLGAEIIPVEISAWKGQLPKKVTERRIRRVLARREAGEAVLEGHSEHAIDAVGIGLFCRGEF